jgi:periplasmic nitrate reductase NapD
MRGNDATRSPTRRSDSERAPGAIRSDPPVRSGAGCASTFSVAGVLVQAHERAANDIAAALREIPGAIVHACAAGKLAITLEAPDPASIVEQLTAIQRMPGVLSAALVSEHSAPLDTIDEELTDE